MDSKLNYWPFFAKWEQAHCGQNYIIGVHSSFEMCTTNTILQAMGLLSFGLEWLVVYPIGNFAITSLIYAFQV